MKVKKGHECECKKYEKETIINWWEWDDKENIRMGRYKWWELKVRNGCECGEN